MVEGWGGGAGGSCSGYREWFSLFRRNHCRNSLVLGQTGGASAVSSSGGALITIPGGGSATAGGNILYISGGNTGAAGNGGGAAGDCGEAGFIPGGGGGASCVDYHDDCDPRPGKGALFARGTFAVRPGDTLTVSVGQGGAGGNCGRRGFGGTGAPGRVMLWY